MKNLFVLVLILMFGCREDVSQDQISENGDREIHVKQSQRKNVAILIFDDVQIIDFTGPYEVFGQTGYNVFTVAEKQDAITTHMKMTVLPSYNFTNHPKADIIVIPGGGAPHHLPKDNLTIQWIAKTSNQVDYILSVCNGTFFLASAGLLNNKKATTYAPMINHIAMYAPNTTPVYNERFVKSGNIVTSGGLSAGIDAALYVVSMDKSIGRAKEVANNMEYNWNPNSGYVRSGLADMQLLNVLDFNPPLFNRKVIQYEGDDSYWIIEYEIERKETLNAFYNQFDEAATMYKWNKTNEIIENNQINSSWSFDDFDNRNWTCETQFSTLDNKNTFRLYIHLNKSE